MGRESAPPLMESAGSRAGGWGSTLAYFPPIPEDKLRDPHRPWAGALKQLVRRLASERLGRCPELAEEPDIPAFFCRARGSGKASALLK